MEKIISLNDMKEEKKKIQKEKDEQEELEFAARFEFKKKNGLPIGEELKDFCELSRDFFTFTGKEKEMLEHAEQMQQERLKQGIFADMPDIPVARERYLLPILKNKISYDWPDVDMALENEIFDIFDLFEEDFDKLYYQKYDFDPPGCRDDDIPEEKNTLIDTFKSEIQRAIDIDEEKDFVYQWGYIFSYILAYQRLWLYKDEITEEKKKQD